ncbi:metallophosphoesterase family protein [uncultured Ruegeria sp.]|uniref:metallophosphoesterase family protein n=1 Tax=uncultured Ruegeria sp. TaxID=259304 RepID=UPI00260E0F51|nr:metallophosphoesterase family protein [uncultured Ruegeria sp.]
MLGLISDIHANLAALEAVLTDAKSKGVTEFVCLGDVIGYNGQPEECVQLLKAEGARNILGNHDSYVTSGQNCERSKVVAGIIDKHLAELSSDSVAWLSRSLDSIQDGTTLFVHGGPQDHVDEYLYEVGINTFPKGVTRLFAGHTHVQCVLDFGTHVFCNPGSVGQPRDGDPRAAYAILSEGQIALHRVVYDIDRTIRAMKDRGYEEFMFRGLAKGAQINGRIDEIVKI